jgi:hypothetical protein
MSLPADYWPLLAADYLTGYALAFPSAGGIASEPSHRNAIIIAMSVAEHETNNGRAWPGTNNFGAVQLRTLTPNELASFQAGTLKAGDYNAAHDGVLHVDTHPPGIPYPVWFAAFPTRAEGIWRYLQTLWRLSAGRADFTDATCADVVKEMYLHGYFEGFHPGARPVGKRTLPLTPPEQANVDDYTGAVQKCRDMIEPQLDSWDYGRDQNVPTVDPGRTVA